MTCQLLWQGLTGNRIGGLPSLLHVSRVSCCKSCWRLFLHNTAHSTSGSCWCVHRRATVVYGSQIWQRASRRSANILLQTNDDRCGDALRRTSRTAVMHYGPRLFFASVATQHLQFGADQATLDRVLVRHLDEELFAKGESAAVSRLFLSGTMYCRGVILTSRAAVVVH